MTVKRNFKRRVRQRQLRTGESYVTARRHMLASRPDADSSRPVGAMVAGTGEAPQGEVSEGAGDGAGETRSSQIDPVRAADAGSAADAVPAAISAAAAASDPEPSTPVSVIELVDVSNHARRAGLVCPIAMFPELARRVAPARVLDRLRTLLVAMHDDPVAAPLVRLALSGRVPAPRKSVPMAAELLRRFLQRANAGIGGMSEDGGTLAFHVADADAMVPVLCAMSAQDTGLVLSTVDELLSVHGMTSELAERSAAGDASARVRELVLAIAGAASMRSAARAISPRRSLVLMFEGQRQGEHLAISGGRFVIGRDHRVVDLRIEDPRVSAEHAEVILRDGIHYLKDLGSEHGTFYKGMRIDSKRIDDGDAFQIGDHVIRFTYRVE